MTIVIGHLDKLNRISPLVSGEGKTMTITCSTIQEEITRAPIQDVVLALIRAERWEQEGDIRAAQQELEASIIALQNEHNRIVQKRRAL